MRYNDNSGECAKSDVCLKTQPVSACVCVRFGAGFSDPLQLQIYMLSANLGSLHSPPYVVHFSLLYLTLCLSSWSSEHTDAVDICVCSVAVHDCVHAGWRGRKTCEGLVCCSKGTSTVYHISWWVTC